MERPPIQKDTAWNNHKEMLYMYEIPGQEAISKHGLGRYLKDKRQDEAIRKERAKQEKRERQPKNLWDEMRFFPQKQKPVFIQKALESPDIRIQKQAAGLINSIGPFETERASLKKIVYKNVLRALNDSEALTQKSGAEMIDFAAEEDRDNLRNIVLQKVNGLFDQPSQKVEKERAELLQHTPTGNWRELIQKALDHPAAEVQVEGAKMISKLLGVENTEKKPLDLVKKALKHQNLQVQKEAAEALCLFSLYPIYQKEQADLMKEGLLNLKSLDAKKTIAQEIKFLKKTELYSLVLEKVNEALNNPDTKIQIEGVRMIEVAPDEYQTELIRQTFKHKNVLVQIEGARMIIFAPRKERGGLIRQALEHQNSEVQKEAARSIYAASEEGAGLVRAALNHPNIEIQKSGARLIRYCHPTDREKLRMIVYQGIAEALGHSDIDTLRGKITMIDYVPSDKKRLLFKHVIEKGWGETLIEPPLYYDQSVYADQFSRKAFAKSGSKTTLLGSTLKNRTIIRHIGPETFLAWQRAYEAYGAWRKAGFDYVPIEPILSYHLNKRGLVDVYSGVLDINFISWRERTSMFVPELSGEKERIISVLDELGIRHGHLHEGNFVLRFYRNKDNKPDFTKTPRLYVIDFDEATSP